LFGAKFGRGSGGAISIAARRRLLAGRTKFMYAVANREHTARAIVR